MERRVLVWLAGPLFFVVVLTAVAVGGRLLGVSSPIFGAIAPSIAFSIAWTAWWPILKPRAGFWRHTAVGVITAVFVMAVTIFLTDSRP